VNIVVSYQLSVVSHKLFIDNLSLSHNSAIYKRRFLVA